jgi:hypothetical protein
MVVLSDCLCLIVCNDDCKNYDSTVKEDVCALYVLLGGS